MSHHHKNKAHSQATHIYTPFDSLRVDHTPVYSLLDRHTHTVRTTHTEHADCPCCRLHKYTLTTNQTLHPTFPSPALPSNPSLICVIDQAFMPFIKTTKHSYSQTQPCPPQFPESTRTLRNVTGIASRRCPNHSTSQRTHMHRIHLSHSFVQGLERVNTNKQMGLLARWRAAMGSSPFCKTMKLCNHPSGPYPSPLLSEIQELG